MINSWWMLKAQQQIQNAEVESFIKRQVFSSIQNFSISEPRWRRFRCYKVDGLDISEWLALGSSGVGSPRRNWSFPFKQQTCSKTLKHLIFNQWSDLQKENYILEMWRLFVLIFWIILKIMNIWFDRKKIWHPDQSMTFASVLWSMTGTPARAFQDVVAPAA